MASDSNYSNPILQDPSFGYLQPLFDPEYAKTTLFPLIHRFLEHWPTIEVQHIRPIKHNEGRRCVIEFCFKSLVDGQYQYFSVMGKSRPKGISSKIIALQTSLARHGFAEDADDGIGIPMFIGEIKEARMWFYRKVEGNALSQLISQKQPIRAADVADIAFKIHRCAYPTWRQHTVQKELDILRSGFDQLWSQQPHWRPRLETLYALCQRIAASLHDLTPTGIHRDFHPDQIIKNERYFVIDFDCYTLGDPSIDIGNFNAYLKAQALRELGDPGALANYEHQIVERYLERAGRHFQHNIAAYTWLSLPRHIYLHPSWGQEYGETLYSTCFEQMERFLTTP